jgi:hypothetical protein
MKANLLTEPLVWIPQNVEAYQVSSDRVGRMRARAVRGYGLRVHVYLGSEQALLQELEMFEGTGNLYVWVQTTESCVVWGALVTDQPLKAHPVFSRIYWDLTEGGISYNWFWAYETLGLANLNLNSCLLLSRGGGDMHYFIQKNQEPDRPPFSLLEILL